MNFPKLLLLALVGASLLSTLPARATHRHESALSFAHHDADQRSAEVESQDPKKKQDPKKGAAKKKPAKPT